jgi:hypothetical protein
MEQYSGLPVPAASCEGLRQPSGQVGQVGRVNIRNFSDRYIAGAFGGEDALLFCSAGLLQHFLRGDCEGFGSLLDADGPGE